MTLDLSRVSVLIVEDMGPMRAITAGMLEQIGVGKVWAVGDGQKAMEVVRKHDPDIIITDWHMEPMDGLSLTQEIRSDPTIPNRFVPIIVVTGFNAMHRVARARDSGVTEFLIKPFSAQDIARRIAYVINRPRDFIESMDYFGPDRRRKADKNFSGQKKRKLDQKSDKDSSDLSPVIGFQSNIRSAKGKGRK